MEHLCQSLAVSARWWMCCADQRQANATSERPTTTTGVASGDGSRDSPSPSSVAAASPPPPRRRSSPADVDTRHNGAPLPYHVTQRPTSGHVTTSEAESKLQEAQQQQQHGSQLMRQQMTGPMYGVDSPTVQYLSHHQSAVYPASYGYDMVAGDARWMLHGQYPRSAFGRGRPGMDYTSSGYTGLVGNATPTLARRATVEYRAQPTTTAAAYSMDYPPLNFAPLPFQAAAGYGKQNY